VKWYEEVRNICGSGIPILLVGLKKDLRDAAGPGAEGFVTRAQVSPPPSTYTRHSSPRFQAESVAQTIGARSYEECSALLNEGVDDIFEAATRAAMLVRSPGTEGKSSKSERGNLKEEEEPSRCGCIIM
jgi:Rho family protein